MYHSGGRHSNALVRGGGVSVGTVRPALVWPAASPQPCLRLSPDTLTYLVRSPYSAHLDADISGLAWLFPRLCISADAHYRYTSRYTNTSVSTDMDPPGVLSPDPSVRAGGLRIPAPRPCSLSATLCLLLPPGSVVWLVRVTLVPLLCVHRGVCGIGRCPTSRCCRPNR